MEGEYRSASREHLYFIYQFLLKQEYIVKNFEFEKNFVWTSGGISKKGIKQIRRVENIDFWNEINKDKFIELSKALDAYCKEQQYGETNTSIRNQRLLRVLNHMRPISDLAWQMIDKAGKKDKRFSYGVYGLYEEKQLVYIGITLNDFREVERKDKTEMKIFFDVSKVKTTVPITKRDLEAMKLCLEYMFKPRDNKKTEEPI